MLIQSYGVILRIPSGRFPSVTSGLPSLREVQDTGWQRKVGRKVGKVWPGQEAEKQIGVHRMGNSWTLMINHINSHLKHLCEIQF